MNKTILITGTSSGIGKASVALFAKNGWNVIATMRNSSEGTDFENLETVFVTPLDITSSESIQKAIELGIQKFGKIDVLLNNAGYAQYGVFESVSEEKIQQQFDVNVFGTMKMIRMILPFFRAQGHGTILNVTSGSGRFAVPLMSIYNASKFALEGFSESLYYELNSQNIAVKIIEPGSTVSNFHHTLEAHTKDIAVPESYVDYNRRLNEAMQTLRENSAGGASTPENIAETIYRATTDGTDQLRYVSGDDIQPIIDLRTSTSEEEYAQFMKNLFTIKN